jgi:hypothetical protein
MFLERYVAAEAAGEFAWINDYKPMARTFLEDHRVFTEWKQMPTRFNSAADFRNAVANVRRLEGKLKMQGALRDALKDETKRLSGLLTEREKTEKQAADAERARLLEQETPAWNTALAEARRRASVYDYAGAAQVIEATPLTAQPLKDAQASERKRLGWLSDWKMILINDLRTGRYTAAINELAGVQYEGVASAVQEEITLRIPGGRGSAAVKWTALKPQTLLGMSLAFILPTAP